MALAVTVGSYIGIQFVATPVLLVVPLLMGWDTVQADRWLNGVEAQFLYVLLAEALTLGVVIYIMRLFKAKLRSIGLVKPRWRDVGYALVGFGLYFLLYLLVLNVVQAIVPTLNLEQEQQLGFEQAVRGYELILVAISLVILPPLVEEILFRGFLYSGLKRKWHTPWAVIVTSLVFAAAHLQFGSGAPLLWVAAIDTFVLSLVLINLRELTDSLWPSILLHALKNGIAFVVIFVF